MKKCRDVEACKRLIIEASGAKIKKGRTQGSPLHFYFLIFHLNALALYHFRYCAIGSDGVDTCG